MIPKNVFVKSQTKSILFLVDSLTFLSASMLYVCLKPVHCELYRYYVAILETIYFAFA